MLNKDASSITEKEFKAVTVGGGNGAPLVNRSLLLAGVKEVTTVSAVFDNGGATKQRIIDSGGNEIAYGDVIRVFPSLIHPDNQVEDPSKSDEENRAARAYKDFVDLFSDRDDKNRVLGQEVTHRFLDPERGFKRIENMMRNFGMDVQGRVLPASLVPSNIVFKTSDGEEYAGEDLLDEMEMYKERIAEMRLVPRNGTPVSAFEPAVQAIRNANLTVNGPGSIHGSVYSGYLVPGMRDASEDNNGMNVLITNLASSRLENHRDTPTSIVKRHVRYTGRKPDVLVVPKWSRREFEDREEHADVVASYAKKGAHYLGWTPGQYRQIEKQGVTVVPHDAISIVPVKGSLIGRRVLRTDAGKLAETFKEIFPKE